MQTSLAEEQIILDAMDLQDLEEYAFDQNFDFMQWTLSLLSGDSGFPENFSALLNQCKSTLCDELSRVLTSVLSPAIMLLILKLIFPGVASIQKTTGFICRLGCIAALSAIFAQMQTVAEELLQEFVRFSNALTPALIAATSLTGTENTATYLSPVTALCVSIVQTLLSKWGIAVSSAAAGIAAAGNLSANIRLNRLHDLLKRFVHWGTAGLLAAFTAILSLQGRLSAGRDSAAARTAKYAIESLIPVIGGNVSDSLDSLLSTANVVRNAIGASGLLLLVCICILPLGKLLGMTLLLHLTSAIAEPLGDDFLTTFIGQFADSVEMLLILCTTAAVLYTLLIGSCISAASSVIR